MILVYVLFIFSLWILEVFRGDIGICLEVFRGEYWFVFGLFFVVILEMFHCDTDLCLVYFFVVNIGICFVYLVVVILVQNWSIWMQSHASSSFQLPLASLIMLQCCHCHCHYRWHIARLINVVTAPVLAH